MKISLPRTLILLAMFAATFFLLQDVAGVHRTPILQPLALFPTHLGEWNTVSSRKSGEEVIKMLGVDDYIEYNYVNQAGKRVNFYAAFYEAVGNGKGYHSPKNCIPGGGWGIDEINTVDITPDGYERSVTVSEMIIRNRNEYQVVYYWFQNRGRVIASEYWEKIFLVTDAILKKRRDGTFVRLMAYAEDGDIEMARKALKDISIHILPELDNFLPGKVL
ncbi:exosortase C-terminal domain/associated protein EpsI [Desulfogranum marinum]|uniref:exosortase C-terminal domain/associated protein EpsI n=1 Tax=Desulfogranum marinum TaxID=453220 RepID=UPI0019638CD4|nr:exosortase C-terminal domain/associated protein EpsI [Desulfogranum marinum]MBM9514547.1 EpsI family protein [Desulfogranum marinum]